MAKPDLINHPPHYTAGGIETIDVMQAKLTPEQFEGYLRGCIIKYILRAGKKGYALDDLKKAQWYLNKLIGEFERVCKKREYCRHFKNKKCTFHVPGSDYVPPDECVLDKKDCPVFEVK